MSDLLNQASLVMIPSGYKEDVVYSEVPTNGNGDLSFTRASNGTRVNSAGLVEVVPWNLVEYSEDFSVGWTLIGGGSFTSNAATAPNGTTTADEYDQGAYVRKHFTLPANYITFTLYVRAKTSSSSFRIGILGVGDASIEQTIQTVGTSWVQMTVTYNNFSGSAIGVFFSIQSGDSEVYIWGAQLNIGSTAKPYFPTTDRLNVPRLTYQNGGGGCPSLLLEKQSTNYFTYSEELQTGTSGTITVTPNATTSPDGTQNADSLGTGYLTKILSATAGTWAFSTFAKYLSANTFNIYIYDGGYYVATFDVSTGVVSSVSSGVTASIQNMGNGWYRCIMTATTANNVIEVGFGSGNVYAWGCQFENSSYPTSYIPTTSSSATRVADACSKTGISSLIGQSQGTLFAEVDVNITGNASNSAFIEINDGTSLNSISFGYYQEGRIQAVSFVSNSLVVNINLPVFGLTTGRHKFAYGYKLNDYILYVDGVQVGSDTSAAVPSTSKLDLYSGGGANIGITQTVLFPTRLTNAELASLTTI